MLDQIDKFQKIGDFKAAYKLLYQFIYLKTRSIKQESLFSLCINQNREFGNCFKDLLSFLSYLKIIHEKNEDIFISDSTKVSVFENVDSLKKHINDRFILKIKKDKVFKKVFPNSSIKFNKTTSSIYIIKGQLNLKFYPIIHFFISSDLFFYQTDSKSILKVSPAYHHEIKKLQKTYSNPDKKRKIITYNQLTINLSKQEERGMKAEQFILKYEQNRLIGHKNYERIEIISNIDVSAGYDIISFKNKDSVNTDKLIEVKSYKGKRGFFWTKNELLTAKDNPNNYFLYLVDYIQMKKNVDYIPEIIANPYNNIYSSMQWFKDERLWYISPHKL